MKPNTGQSAPRMGGVKQRGIGAANTDPFGLNQDRFRIVVGLRYVKQLEPRFSRLKAECFHIQ
jgi:hypothetical protein